MKKAQMEILGLAILFVIVIFGFLLFLKFMGDDPTPLDEYYKATLPNDMLLAFEKTSFVCNGISYTMHDLLIDATDDTYGNNIQCGDEKTSAKRLQELGNQLVSTVMGKLGKEYWFAVWNEEVYNYDYGYFEKDLSDGNSDSSNNFYISQSSSGKCKVTSEGQAGFAHSQYRLSNSKVIYIGMNICD